MTDAARKQRSREVLIDLAGKRFGRWTVIAYAGRATWAGDYRWACVCDCGTRRTILEASLRKGETKLSCGCPKRLRHGMTGTKEYRAWQSMLQRCFNPQNRRYRDYGGRGITVCELYCSFLPWFADIGLAPSPDHSHDRINNDRGYEPGNIHWATRSEQMRNRRPWKKNPRIKLGDPKILAGIRQLTESLARAGTRT